MKWFLINIAHSRVSENKISSNFLGTSKLPKEIDPQVE